MRLRLLLAVLLAFGISGPVCAQSVADLIVQADRYWAEGRLDETQRAFEAAAAAEPGSAAAQLRLAGFQLSQRQLDASARSYRRAISLEPDNARAWLGLGLACLHQGKRELARSAFEQATQLDSRQAQLLAPLLSELEAH